MTREDFCLVGEEVRTEPLQYRSCGLDGIYLLNGYSVENHDGERHVSVTKMEELHQAIGLHLVTRRKGLAPKEIRFLRDTMGLTQAELAARLGNDQQSVARWEKGNCEAPGASEKLLRLVFLVHFMDDDDLRSLRGLVEGPIGDLDALDQTESPEARFEWGDRWSEQPRELCYA